MKSHYKICALCIVQSIIKQMRRKGTKKNEIKKEKNIKYGLEESSSSACFKYFIRFHKIFHWTLFLWVLLVWIYKRRQCKAFSMHLFYLHVNTHWLRFGWHFSFLFLLFYVFILISLFLFAMDKSMCCFFLLSFSSSSRFRFVCCSSTQFLMVLMCIIVVHMVQSNAIQSNKIKQQEFVLCT